MVMVQRKVPHSAFAYPYRTYQPFMRRYRSVGQYQTLQCMFSILILSRCLSGQPESCTLAGKGWREAIFIVLTSRESRSFPIHLQGSAADCIERAIRFAIPRMESWISLAVWISKLRCEAIALNRRKSKQLSYHIQRFFKLQL